MNGEQHGAVQFEACIDARNKASRALVERLGFVMQPLSRAAAGEVVY